MLPLKIINLELIIETNYYCYPKLRSIFLMLLFFAMPRAMDSSRFEVIPCPLSKIRIEYFLLFLQFQRNYNKFKKRLVIEVFLANPDPRA